MNVYLEVYGCTANKGDASLISGLLQETHQKIVKKLDDADVLILLTCTVIGTTEQRMLSRLRVFKKTGKKVIVAGCMTSVQSELIKSIVPDAKLLPPQYSHHIVDLLDDKKVTFTPKNKTLFSKYFDDLAAQLVLLKDVCYHALTA